MRSIIPGMVAILFTAVFMIIMILFLDLENLVKTASTLTSSAIMATFLRACSPPAVK